MELCDLRAQGARVAKAFCSERRAVSRLMC